MVELYSRIGKEYFDCIVEVLYVTKTGEIIIYAQAPKRVPLESGEREKIKSGEWKLEEINFTAELLAELEDKNVQIVKSAPALIGERKYSEQKPTLTSIERL